MNDFIDRSTPPEVHPFGPLSLQKPWTLRLDNGITLHVIASADSDVCRMAIALPGGDDSKGPQAPYDVISQMLLEGTATKPGDVIASSLENHGAWCGTGVSTSHTTLTVNCLCEHLAALLPLMREIVFESAFAPGSVGNVLDRLAARAEVDRCKVSWQAADSNRRAVYGPDSPLAYSPTPQQIREFSPDLLRSAHRARLDTAGMHIFLSGGITPAMIKAVEREFGPVNTGVLFKIPSLVFPEHRHGADSNVVMNDAVQSAVRISIPAIGRNHPDFVPLRIAVIALGGYFGSRLMLNIREDKGLTYGISATLPAFREHSFINISSQCDPSNTQELIKEVNREMLEMRFAETYTTDELQRLSRHILSGLATTLDTPVSRMDYYQSVFLAGAPEGYFAAQDAAARSITPVLLASMAEKYFDPERSFVTIAGPI